MLINARFSESRRSNASRAALDSKILYPQIAGDNLVGVDTANICTRDRNKGWRVGGDGGAGEVGARKVYVGYRGTGSLIQEMFANLLIMPRLLAGLLVIANT